MLLGISDLEETEETFPPDVPSLKAAAEILQNAIFRPKGGNRQRIKKKKKKKKIIGKFHSVSWAVLCTDFRPQGHHSSVCNTDCRPLVTTIEAFCLLSS